MEYYKKSPLPLPRSQYVRKYYLQHLTGVSTTSLPPKRLFKKILTPYAKISRELQQGGGLDD